MENLSLTCPIYMLAPCPIVGACTWQARYGYVNIMHADICVYFHALRVHHRFRQAALPGRPLRTRPMAVFFCGLHSFPSPVLRYRRGRPKGVPL